jgi:hypothetical protein
VNFALPWLASLAMGFAAVASLAPRLSHAQRLGASLAVGPALNAVLFALCFMAGLPLDSCAWILLAAACLAAIRAAGRARPEPTEHAEWIGIVGGLLMAITLFLRLLAVPVARGDGIAIHLLRAEAILQGCFWEWAKGAPAASLHADYPLGMPALMAHGQILCGARSDIAALAPLVLVLPGALLFIAATLARTTGTLSALAASLLMLCVPVLRTHAVAGYADPLLAAGVLVGGLALALHEPRLAFVAALSLPWLKHEGILHAGLLTLFLSHGARFRVRAAMLLALALSAGLWFADLGLHGVEFPIAESLPDDARAEVLTIASRWFALAFTNDAALAAVPGLGLVAALLLGRDPRWKPTARILIALSCAQVLLVVVRGTAHNTVLAGDTLQRLFAQTLPLAILLVGAATQKVFAPRSTP